MAVVYYVTKPGAYLALGLSSDTKPPTPPNEAVFMETDTGAFFHAVAAAWVALPDGSAVWGGITGTLANQTDLAAALDGKQPLDADLTAIAGLTLTTDSFMQAKSNAWASRTIAQVKTDLSLAGVNTGDQVLPTRESLGLATTDSPQFAGVNVGDAADTTITRVSAGVIAVEGVQLATVTDIVQSALAPAGDETITAGYAAYVSDYYEVADQKFLEVGAGAVFEVG